ncbi:uncharacterized protein BDCG_17396 [Blastomyces dermatitidis ER-3]|uniref:Secreted protein n=1 Tax=Ajellomyces dermatitidis (strain ER-3 / ATCC MYA-2586) TaxID=559297 RepID=A0ABX2VZ54_AJEDR|nr:uncharacterized protein BDCG_17396 [Blastomyces dermatitidis ER-3]OAT02133.1 hypothetical protein BDCG_17396 [Blastomyces dermatitidis ER-3]
MWFFFLIFLQCFATNFQGGAGTILSLQRSQDPFILARPRKAIASLTVTLTPTHSDSPQISLGRNYNVSFIAASHLAVPSQARACPVPKRMVPITLILTIAITTTIVTRLVNK